MRDCGHRPLTASPSARTSRSDARAGSRSSSHR
jgi:hypothetical protein